MDAVDIGNKISIHNVNARSPREHFMEATVDGRTKTPKPYILALGSATVTSARQPA
jgi:hypothetical protein